MYFGTCSQAMMAAGQVSDRCSDIWVPGDCAYMVAKESKIQTDTRNMFNQIMRTHSGENSVPWRAHFKLQLHEDSTQSVWRLHLCGRLPEGQTLARPGRTQNAVHR